MKEKESKKKGESLKKNLRRLFLSFLIIIITLEILLHIAYLITQGSFYPVMRARAHPPLYRSDPVLGWRVRSNLSITGATKEFTWHIDTDESGYRKTGSNGRDENILLIGGDSFAFGWAVEGSETFACRLDSIPGGFWGRSVTIGVPGFGLEQEEILLKETLSAIHPKLLLLEVWPLDWDILDAEQMVERDHYLISRSALSGRPEWWVSARIALVNWSPLFNFYDKANKIASEKRRGQALHNGYGLDAFCRGEQSGVVCKARERAFISLRNIKKMADSENIPFVIAIVPSSFQVHKDDLPQWIKAYGISGEVDIDRPQRELEEFARNEGILCVDLLPDFKIVGREKRLYYHLDPHWNGNGHALAAEIIAKALKSTPFDRANERH